MITLHRLSAEEFDRRWPWMKEVLSGWQGHSKPMSFYTWSRKKKGT